MNGKRHSTAENGGAPSVRTSYGNTTLTSFSDLFAIQSSIDLNIDTGWDVNDDLITILEIATQTAFYLRKELHRQHKDQGFEENRCPQIPTRCWHHNMLHSPLHLT
jgi:hypothetical protein